ncbi:ddx20 [Symbiodinium pilosum]|uniref:Ddx20 protein n=1 Tax=Symbiodinium pilosum TaxID=2952 RepID=A0A812VSU4_SYMPI|nr:ddx20 [Symbiodinium pilosum]
MPRFKTSDVVDSETQQCTFADLSLSAPLLQALQEMGCEHPSPVQLRTIPQALAGGDVIVQAKSGTGKTIAFCSVVLEGVNTSSSGTSQAIVLAPTREIAMQIADELRRLGWYMVPVLDVACFIGGVPVEEDEERLESKGAPHIAVGTPGRMLKLLREGSLLTDARFLVLDEADKLLDTNFRQDITAITELVFTKSLQFLAVSATFPPPLVALAEDLFVHVEKKRATRGQPVMRDLPNKVFLCTSAVKKDKDGLNIIDGGGEEPGDVVETALLKGVLHLRYVLQGYHVRQKVPALLEVLTTAAYQQAFVFVGDSNNAIQIAELLNQAGVPAAASTGKLDQAWRTQAFAGLKRFQYRVLVCTDLMARGIDAEKVDVVVNLDLPVEKETYLHRSGRTARFGSVGWMVSLVFEGDEAEHLHFFQMQLGFELAEYADREAAIQSRLEALSLPQDALGPSQIDVEQFPQQPFPTPGAPSSTGRLSTMEFLISHHCKYAC